MTRRRPMPSGIAGAGRGNPRRCKREDLAVLPFFFWPCFPWRLPICVPRRLSPTRRRPISKPVTQRSGFAEPIFNVPPVIVATVALLVAVHLLRTFILTDEQDVAVSSDLCFYPGALRHRSSLRAAHSRAASAPIFGHFSPTPSSMPILPISASISLGSFLSALRLARRFGAWRFVVFHAGDGGARRAGTSRHPSRRNGSDDRRIGRHFGRHGGGDAVCFSARAVRCRACCGMARPMPIGYRRRRLPRRLAIRAFCSFLSFGSA